MVNFSQDKYRRLKPGSQAYEEFVLFHWSPQLSLGMMFISCAKGTRILAYASEPSEIHICLDILSKETEEQILWREVKE